MAVEILFLSGARQGERLLLDCRGFKAGSDPGCEVFFDSRNDPAIKGRSAAFRLQEDGWYIRSAGGDALVNQQSIAGWTRVRSGDVVRMSESGPDFSFGIVAGAAASPARTPANPNELALLAEILGAESEIAGPDEVGDALAWSPGKSFIQTVEPECRSYLTSATMASPNRRWAVWVMGGLAVALVGFLFGRSLFNPTVIINVNQRGVPTVSQDGSSDTDSSPVSRRNPETPVANRAETSKAASETEKESRQKQTADKQGQAVDIGSRLRNAVFLLQVEKSGQCWPFATCVAISPDTLLTTAREAWQLAKWRKESGFKIWATRPADGVKEEVRDIRAHDGFASLAEKGGDWIYLDVGLLTVDGSLPAVVPLASVQESAALEAGVPVSCLGFTHEGEKVTRFDHFEPQFMRGKVYFVTVSRELPGQPRLLHVKAEIPKNVCGSPVVNAAGKLIGLYGEVAAPPSGNGSASGAAELKNMHYVTIVNPETIDRWLRDRSEKTWPRAAPARTPQKTQDNP